MPDQSRPRHHLLPAGPADNGTRRKVRLELAAGLISLARPLDAVSAGLAVVLGMLIAAEGTGVPAATGLAGFAAGFLLLAGADTINDAADARTDAIAKPWRPIPSGKVTRRAALIAGSLETAAGLAVAATLSPATLLISLAGALLAAAYSWRLSLIFLVKNATVAATLTLPIVAGGAAVATSWPPLLWSLLPVVFLSIAAFEVHKDVLDAIADRMTGRRTVANTLPAGVVPWVVAAAYATAYGSAWWLASEDALGVVYRWSLGGTGVLLTGGLLLLWSRSPGALRASFLVTNAAILVMLVAVAVEVL